ncbi:hypothetical protein [Dickeya fangzhongdai]|uniref:hypothetical protein n=1 Tax=Dickeya fangzhongdai TaxID=1778540 RepID=UPI0004F74930|nr:hypothetical protein [Dickeya fangzhongdai]AIR71482.1 hypothetical protein LH89_20555 [Dickeya fangzhongdai]KGT98510.1 hypothetical protein NM75_09290 [Dickeya fangzhongdai]
MKKLFAIAVITFSLFGCVSLGNNFDEARLVHVSKGQTTKQDVIALFGDPSTTSIDSDGNQILIWSYSIGNGFGGAIAKILTIKLHDGKVDSYSVTQSKI